jgi:hypothetical protein
MFTDCLLQEPRSLRRFEKILKCSISEGHEHYLHGNIRTNVIGLLVEVFAKLHHVDS